ncbi:MAG: tetratricopeptide repeat protein [Filifactoraceae bacterium]
MLDEIKAYWYQIKTEYENKYKEPFLRDFEKSKEYFEIMREYLLKKQDEFPSDIDIICTLASIKLELGNDELSCIELLEKFLKEYEDFLDNNQRARIYTNIAFYYDYGKLGLEYLMKACKLESPFVETYKGLGLFYFSEYQFYKDDGNLTLGKKYFKIASDMDKSYEYTFGYAVCLYELREYEKAKEIFITLLNQYPNRMRIMLCISYCEAYLGNREKAIFYLKQVKAGQDEKYSLGTDDIGDYEIFDAYYVLKDYDTFLMCWKDVVWEYFSADWEHYFYTLWLKNEKELFFRLEEKNRTYFEDAIKEAEVDEDFDSEEEKKELMDDWEKDKRKFNEMIDRIKGGASKPRMQLSLYPDFSCFLIDCVRHKFL